MAIFYGSLVSRWKKGEVTLPEGTDTTLAAKLPEPLFDPTTKSETRYSNKQN